MDAFDCPNLSCQDVFTPKGFDMKNRPKPRIRPVDYHLGCCIEARFGEIAITGRTVRVRLGCSGKMFCCLGGRYSEEGGGKG